MSKPANAQDTFAQDLARLCTGFRRLEWMLKPNGATLSPSKVKEIYDELFGETVKWNSITPAKSNPRFDEATYPSLFDAIPVLPNNEALLPNWWGTLPTGSNWWENKDVVVQMAESPLLRALVAFLWKQGELQTASTLIQALRPQDGAPTGGNAAVMRQFGKHLLEPLEQPIFDQHTSRALLLFEGKDWWKTKVFFTRNGYLGLFGRGPDRVPTTDSSLTNGKRRDLYVTWWSKTVERRLPKLTDSDRGCWKMSARAQTLLWTDRLMFSLGKSALGLYQAVRATAPAPNPEQQDVLSRSRTPSA